MDEQMDMAPEGEEDGDAFSVAAKQVLLLSMLAKRREAVNGRQASGIEEEWMGDEEAYEGIDDANRAYVATHSPARSKQWAERAASPAAPGRSVVYLNITRPYVDAAAARISDMLLPTDDRAWAIKPTPSPSLKGMSPEMVLRMGGAEDAAATLEQIDDQAKAAAEVMQTEIDDCLVESGWHGEVRHVIEDAARLGSGVLKGPYPKLVSTRMYQDDGLGGRALVSMDQIRPASRRINPWDFYPDPACGESLHGGSYTWEREYVSERRLRDLVHDPAYDSKAILEALAEGPSSANRESGENGFVPAHARQFEMWIHYGQFTPEELSAAGLEVEAAQAKQSKTGAMAVIVNDRLIKIALNVLDTGDFPYDILAWQRKPGMPWGSGVASHIRTPQRMLNGAARAMLDNAGLSASPQIIIGKGVSPADGTWNIKGGKLWRLTEEGMDVRQSFHAFVPPSVQGPLMEIIQFARTMAEDITGMPAMIQGIRGDAPQTLGGMQMQNNNATSVLRRLAKRFDDYVTRPHIRRYFDWMMQYNDREDIKGDFDIDVRASSALVERDAQQQFLLQMASMAANPIYGIDPAKLFAELCKGQRLDPKRFQYPPEQIEQMRNPQADPVAEAQAKLITAQTAKVEAEAATKNVEGMFSATQAASNIAIQPGIAGAADAMWRSAGGKDADAAPAIPGIEGDVGAIPPEVNTNPLTPVNPAVGMNKGIEGGEA